MTVEFCQCPVHTLWQRLHCARVELRTDYSHRIGRDGTRAQHHGNSGQTTAREHRLSRHYSCQCCCTGSWTSQSCCVWVSQVANIIIPQSQSQSRFSSRIQCRVIHPWRDSPRGLILQDSRKCLLIISSAEGFTHADISTFRVVPRWPESWPLLFDDDVEQLKCLNSLEMVTWRYRSELLETQWDKSEKACYDVLVILTHESLIVIQ